MNRYKQVNIYLNAFCTISDKYFMKVSSDFDNTDVEFSWFAGLLVGIVKSFAANRHGDLRSGRPLTPF